MTFQEMKELFLKQPRYAAYYAELDNFEAYLLTQSNGNINQIYLQGIRTEDIIQSIKYITNDRRRYTSKSIALKYMTAIAQFFRYATKQDWFRNDNFLLMAIYSV